MAEFASMRASVTGSAVPMQGYSYGSEMKSGETSDETGNIYVDLDSVNVNNGNITDEGADGVGNTVTFGGVETFATNSAAGSTIGAMTEGKRNNFCRPPLIICMLVNPKCVLWQTVKTLMKCHIMWHFIRVNTVC